MPKKIFQILCTGILLISCKENSKNEIKPIEVESSIEVQSKHGYIKDIKKKSSDKYSITIDFVDFLSGETALEVAKRNNDLDYTIHRGLDTIFFLNSDYYISNPDFKIQEYELNSKIPINMIVYENKQVIHKKVSISDFIKKLNPESILIFKIKNGVVIEIKEQYLP